MKTPKSSIDRKPPDLSASGGAEPAGKPAQPRPDKRPREIGGREGPEPTRYGDWEKDGRAVDF